jgi:hypothetical protein
MIRRYLTVRPAAAAAALLLGVVFIADWPLPAAQEAAQGKPRPEAVAAADRARSGSRNVIEGTDGDDRLTGGDADDWVFSGKGQDVIVGGKGRDVVGATATESDGRREAGGREGHH